MTQIRLTPRPVTTAKHPLKTLFFVDHAVEDSGMVLADLTPGTIVKRLPRAGDALDAIASLAEIQTVQIDRIVILSRGAPGTLRLSGRDIDSAALRNADGSLGRIRATLTPKAEIVLMACATGAGAAGHAFLRTLGIATGATVKAAETNIGGSADRDPPATTAVPVDESVLGATRSPAPMRLE
ncbi:DUF4347 domain-containing protein [Nisaea sp.]|uniref:DUF4347 domain-containing protein n=1 Tax=Nisaea sp. TaxID=2024842 RepID=UPI0032EB87DC